MKHVKIAKYLPEFVELNLLIDDFLSFFFNEASYSFIPLTSTPIFFRLV